MFNFGPPAIGRMPLSWEDCRGDVTMMLPGLEGLRYRERLGKLQLPSLERWRLRDNLTVYTF